MTITATEFQQNVGKYFRLAEQGEVINIERLKPKGAKFKLIFDKAKTKIHGITRRKNRWDRLLEDIDAIDVEWDMKKGETSVDYQRKYRS